VIERVRRIIGGAVTDMVHNHHNYAWRERHDGRDLWVVRKGATPAFPGQRGFVGGSMGDDAVIIEGVDSPEAKASLYSTIHGAGRLFGRKEAKRRFTRAEMDAWLQSRGVTLVGATGNHGDGPKACDLQPLSRDGARREQGRPLANRRCRPHERIQTGLQLLTRAQGGKLKWDEKTLDQWLQNPTGDVHGSKMFITVPNAGDRQNVIAYLETLK